MHRAKTIRTQRGVVGSTISTIYLSPKKSKPQENNTKWQHKPAMVHVQEFFESFLEKQKENPFTQRKICMK